MKIGLFPAGMEGTTQSSSTTGTSEVKGARALVIGGTGAIGKVLLA